MAIFLVMAWAVQLGEFVGIVKTVPQTSQGRAYEKAQKAAQWLRYHLASVDILEVSPQRLSVRVHQAPQTAPMQTLQFLDGQLRMSSNQGARCSNLVDEHFSLPEERPEFDLGPSGWLLFKLSGRSLTVELQAGDDSLGQMATHQTRLYIPNCYHPDKAQ